MMGKTQASKIREFLPTIYEKYGPLNARQYAYRTEAAGIIDTSMGKKKPFNYVNHILVELRESGILPWSAVLDSSRRFSPWRVTGSENIEEMITQTMKEFKGLPTNFSLPLWQYQPIVPVILTEKEGMVPYFEAIANERRVSVYPHKGQVGKSHLHEVVLPWMIKLMASGKIVQILYLGDVDDEGFQIPLTMMQTITKWMKGSPQFDVHDLYPRSPSAICHDDSVIRFKRIALMPEQVDKMGLSILKVNPKSSIANKFVDYKCELEAMEPDMLRELLEHEINKCWDSKEEKKRKVQTTKLRKKMKEKVDGLTENWPDAQD